MPGLDTIEELWKKKWENEKHHNETAQWMKQQNLTNKQMVQKWDDISENKVSGAV